MKGYTAKVGLDKSRLHSGRPRPAIGLFQILSPEHADALRRRMSIEAAKKRVASIPESHRRYLQGEFQRAEAEGAAILRAKGPTQR